MPTEATANAGLTDDEIAAMADLDNQIDNASPDDPVFNIDDVVRKPQTAEDAGLLNSKGEDNAAAEALAAQKVIDDAAAAKAVEDAAAAKAADDAGKTPEELAATAAAQAEQQPAPEVKVVQPVLVAQVPEGTVERLAAIGDEKKAITAKFDDGDLTASEMNAELEALNKEERKLERVIDRAEIATDLENQRVTNERNQEINTFLAGVNIPYDPKNLRFQALNQAIIQIANDPANVNLSLNETMQKSYDLCVAEGVLPPKAPKTDPAPDTGKTTPPAKPKVLDAPPNIGGLPSSAVQTTEENRFAHLNRMGPDAREAAFAKMSQADQDAYLAAGA